MKGLSMGEWALIARYLKRETGNGDLDQFKLLIEAHPNLRVELAGLAAEINTPKTTVFAFNADVAFKRLNERFELDNLI